MELNKIKSVGGRIMKFRFGIGALLVGIIFAVIGILMFTSGATDATYAPVEATITEVNGMADVDNSLYDVTITYTVNGKDYFSTTMANDEQVENMKMTIYYDVENPNNYSTSEDNGPLFPIVLIGIGGVAAVIGVVSLVKAIATKTPDELQQVDMSKVSQEEIDAIKNSDEPTKEYYFHFCGKLNQSYVLETPERQAIIDLACDKIAIVGKFKFTFTNHLTGRATEYEVGHTTTSSYGAGGFSIPTKSSFKVNGKDVFKLIGEMGYSIISKIEGLKLNFDICHYGVKVASLNAAGANVAKANKDYGKLGNLPTQGVFTVNARESDLDAVALIAFAVSRVEFF